MYRPQRASPAWVSDAWHLLQRHPDLDWDLFVDTATRSHLALLAGAALEYLVMHLEIVVPSLVMHKLHHAAECDALGFEGAVFAARFGAGASYLDLIRAARCWRARSRIVQHALAPSREYLRSLGHLGDGQSPARYYVQRLLRAVLRHA